MEKNTRVALTCAPLSAWDSPSSGSGLIRGRSAFPPHAAWSAPCKHTLLSTQGCEAAFHAHSSLSSSKKEMDARTHRAVMPTGLWPPINPLETHHPEGRQTCCYHRQQAFCAAWLHSVQQSLGLLTRTSWRWYSKGKINRHENRDWYLSHASHSPQIPFPLPSYTLDMCRKHQIKPKVREKGLFPKTKSSTAQYNIPFSLTTRERISNAVTFWGVWVGWGWGTQCTRPRHCSLKGQLSFGGHTATQCTDCCRSEGLSLATNSSTFFCTNRYSGQEIVTVLLPPITSWSGKPCA